MGMKPLVLSQWAPKFGQCGDLVALDHIWYMFMKLWVDVAACMCTHDEFVFVCPSRFDFARNVQNCCPCDFRFIMKALFHSFGGVLETRVCFMLNVLLLF